MNARGNNFMGPDTALIVVDMQNYYLKTESAYYRYFNYLHPGCLDYLMSQAYTIVIPAIRSLISFFNSENCPVVYLRLCGTDPSRRDLHRFFRETNEKAKNLGFDNVYPLESDPFADVIPELNPGPGSIVINKMTFSAFSSSDIESILNKNRISTLVFTGLATSQCVETTARDASDRGFNVIHISDAQSDYDDYSHSASLYSSAGVCGGTVMESGTFIHSGLHILSPG